MREKWHHLGKESDTKSLTFRQDKDVISICLLTYSSFQYKNTSKTSYVYSTIMTYNFLIHPPRTTSHGLSY